MVNSGLFWVGTVNSQKHTKTTLQSHYSTFTQNSAKKTYLLFDEWILEIFVIKKVITIIGNEITVVVLPSLAH